VSSDRLTSANKRALIFWVIAGIAGALFAYKYYFRAFPEASVNFKVSRGEALTRAKQFLSGMGEDAGSYQSAIVFEVNDDAKTYLERELGLAQANQLMSAELNIWYWDVRFFKAAAGRRISSTGKPGRRDCRIRAQSGGSTTGRYAGSRDSTVRRGKFSGSKMGVRSGWDLLPKRWIRINDRTDWTGRSRGKKHGFRAKDAPYRLNVVVQGDKIGGSEEYLKVPEAWERGYKKLRSTNILYNQIALIPYLLLMGSALWMGISLWRKGEADWIGATKLEGW